MRSKDKVLTGAVCILATAGIIYSVSTQNFNTSQPAKDHGHKTVSIQQNDPNVEVEYKDGTYEGEAEGFGGVVRVSVVIEDGKIKSVEILSHSETPEYYERAYAVIAEIVANNTPDVDSVSGATVTSDAIKEAVFNAIEKARTTVDKTVKKKPKRKKEVIKKVATSAKRPIVPGSTSVQTSGLKDGTYIGTGMGLNGAIQVRVTVRNNVLVNIEIISHSEDSPYFENAMSVIQRILSSGSGNVETVSGATYSSQGIIDAVKDALKKAQGESNQANSENNSSSNSGNNGGSGQNINGGNQGSGDIPIVIPNELDSFYIKGEMSDGEYIGYGVGFHGWGTIKTNVTVKDAKIVDIKVSENKSEYADDMEFRDKAMNIINHLQGEKARKTVAVSSLYMIYKDQLLGAKNPYDVAVKLFGKEYAESLKTANLELASTKIKAVSKVIKEYLGDRYDAKEMFDAVSGATISGNGIAQSVGDAMKKSVNDATKKNNVKDTKVTEPKHKVIYANTREKLDLSKLKVTLIKKDNTEEVVSVKDFESRGIEMFDTDKKTPITDGMSLKNYPAIGRIEVTVKHVASITQDKFTIELGNYSTDYVNQIHYSLDGNTWYRVENIVMDPDNPENIFYLKQVIDAPESFKYKNIKVRVISKSGEMYEYTTKTLAGAGRESLYEVVDAKNNSNVPGRLYIQFKFSGTEEDKDKVPDSAVTPPNPEKPESENDGKEVLVGGDVIFTDLDYSKDIDYNEGHPIKPIKVILHDKDAEIIHNIENLPKGLSFNGSEIVGTPEIAEDEWDPTYYKGLHKEFKIKIKAKKGNVVLTRATKIVIRRDRDRDGVADYNEIDFGKHDIFNPQYKDFEPVEVNGVVPTVKDYAAKIKNLPEKGVKVEILEKPDLSKVGDTSVTLGFRVDGLEKVGKAVIKVKVIKVAENKLDEVPVGADVIFTDLDYSKDIDYNEGHPIKPIKVTLHDKDAEIIHEIENLPKGLSFNGSEIVGTPEIAEDEWDPTYYNGLHKEFKIKIKAQKGNIVLVRSAKIVIRRDRDRDGVADYNEIDLGKHDIFNARLTDYEPIEVNGVAPTLEAYKAKIKNLPEKGVTVKILEGPNLGVVGKTAVKLGFQVDGLSKVGEISIQIVVKSPITKQTEGKMVSVVPATTAVTDENVKNIESKEADLEDVKVEEPEKQETEPVVSTSQNEQDSQTENPVEPTVSEDQTRLEEKGDETQK